MNVTDKALKDAYRTYLRGLRPLTRRGCPPTDDLIRFFSDDSPRRFKNHILDHVAGCGACAEEFEILIALDRRTRAFSDEVARLRAGRGCLNKKEMRRGFYGAVRWGMAAAGMVAVALVLWFRPFGAIGPPGDPGPLRAGKSLEIILEAPQGRVDATQSLVFRWRLEGNEAAARPCVVVLYDDSLLEIWRSGRGMSMSRPLPEDLRGSLIPERSYFWGVSSADGPGIFESDLAAFSIKRRPGF